MRMGNESSSHLTGLKVDDSAIEVTDFWVHHSAKVIRTDSIQELSVFVSEVCDSLWDNKSPLEKYTKSLMLYRHPCILKYISSWNKGSKYYLTVERVRPLSHVLSTQSTLQICIGLYSILKALIFLHAKASVSHNNVCSASIYVTQDGSWKLGGLEFLCTLDNLSRDYLSKTRVHRYENGIDPNEDKHIQDVSIDRDFIDQYAYAILVEETLRKRCADEKIPTIKAFYDFCKTEMRASDVMKRPSFSDIVAHPFFNQEFVNIHSFLNELPLKTEGEKSVFFSNLIEKLKLFPEETVAENLGDLLLSRLVLLDATAQKLVIPVLMKPKINQENEYLFSLESFKKYISPKLLEVFKVTDLQIRELLLKHFNDFIGCFSTDQLKAHILPQLLLGIKDKNDHLVAMTLRSLADLVPILGSETVIGSKRVKLFSDGRPKVHNTTTTETISPRVTPSAAHKLVEPSLPVLVEETEFTDIEERPDESPVCLTERLSPDGGEDHTSATENDDLDWSDWDAQETMYEQPEVEERAVPVPQCTAATNYNKKEIVLPDILELDIKSQKCIVSTTSKSRDDTEIDFFQDMEPVIDCSNKYVVSTPLTDSKLSFNGGGDQTEDDAWNEGLDWNIEN